MWDVLCFPVMVCRVGTVSLVFPDPVFPASIKSFCFQIITCQTVQKAEKDFFLLLPHKCGDKAGKYIVSADA